MDQDSEMSEAKESVSECKRNEEEKYLQEKYVSYGMEEK